VYWSDKHLHVRHDPIFGRQSVASVVFPSTLTPWQFSLRDCLRHQPARPRAGGGNFGRHQLAGTLLTPLNDYRIEPHLPSVDDYLRLREASGLSPFSKEAAEKGLPNSIFGVCLMSGGAVIGMGRIIGDGGCFFQVTDIAIMPEHRGRGLGKMIMAALMDHIESKLPKTAYVSLIADVPANRLYQQFGFTETAPCSVGMAKKVS